MEGSTFSPGAREAICLLDAQRSFETGKDLLERQTQEELANVWNPKKPSPREVVEDARRLYFSPDGTTVLTQEKWKEAKMGYFIGSGVTESGCKYLVGQRLKQAGMRWAIEGAQSMLQLRVAYLNGRWDSLWLN
ncbi:MAG: hypothetical protein HY748_14805 [Elusimicrobia bacterium]|nr:hypothetical protein [Elusimicrobiota bacterium]